MREMVYAGARRLIWGLCEVYTALIRKDNSFCLFCVWGVHGRRDVRWEEVDNEWQIWGCVVWMVVVVTLLAMEMNGFGSA